MFDSCPPKCSKNEVNVLEYIKPMKNLIVLFNLLEGVNPSDYESWARTTDLPSVRGLKSVRNFSVYKSLELMGSNEKAPYAYIEVIAISDMDRFGKEVGSTAMQQVASQFQSFAEDPLFIITEALSE